MVNLANFLMKQAQFGTPPTDTEGRVWVYQFEHPYGKVFPEWMGAIETSDFVVSKKLLEGGGGRL